MDIIKKIYCYLVFVLLFIFLIIFHSIFGFLFVFINPDAFHNIISKFEFDLCKVIEIKAKGVYYENK